MVSHVKDAVDARGHQLLLVVSKVAHHVLGNKDDAALAVDDEEETVEGLKCEGREAKGRDQNLVAESVSLCVCVCEVFFFFFYL